jgi:hypothetical protein
VTVILDGLRVVAFVELVVLVAIVSKTVVVLLHQRDTRSPWLLLVVASYLMALVGVAYQQLLHFGEATATAYLPYNLATFSIGLIAWLGLFRDVGRR